MRRWSGYAAIRAERAAPPSTVTHGHCHDSWARQRRSMVSARGGHASALASSRTSESVRVGGRMTAEDERALPYRADEARKEVVAVAVGRRRRRASALRPRAGGGRRLSSAMVKARHAARRRHMVTAGGEKYMCGGVGMGGCGVDIVDECWGRERETRPARRRSRGQPEGRKDHFLS